MRIPDSIREGLLHVTYVTRRWLVIGVYALLASLVVSYGFQPLGTWWLNLLSRVSNSNAGFELFVSLTVATLVILLIHQFAQTRLSHARWFSYPALPVAVVLALALASYWPAFHRWGTAIERPSNAVCMIAIAFYFAVWLSQTAILSIWTRLTDKLESKQFDGAAPLATKRIGEMSDDELLGWLKRESPIRTPSQDVFGFAEFAMRTLRRLDKGDNTIAVQGEYGAGKTSFIHLLEHYSEHKRVWFVRVSCWGFEDAVAAQQSVLSSLIRRLTAEVDCLAMRGLPKNYTTLVGKKLEWLAVISPWAAPEETPVEQLQRLTPLLRAIRAKVVVIVEDVDRAGEKFDVSSIFALLAQFREVPGLSFILSISPHQIVDFAKLCESTEILPKPSVEQITEIFQRVRELLINRYPGDELLDKVEDLRSYEDSHSLIVAMAPGIGYWPSAVIELLRVPRILKRVVRRVILAWYQLHGEMSIDVLFMTAALRESAPAAYSFFELNADRIENAGASRPLYLRSDDHDREVLRQELKTEWEEILSEKSFNKHAIEVLLVNLFPPASFLTSVQTFPSGRTQGPSGDRGSIYRRRLFTEHLLPTEPKDQEVLSLLRNDESGLKELAVRIVADESFARLFEYLGRSLKQDTLRTLLSRIHDELRRQFGNRADLQAAEGVFAPWRLAERFGNDELRQQWVISELKKCVPGYLRLLHSIYYFWLGADRHSLEERQPVREAVLTTAKTVFEKLSIEKFCSSFDPTFPYTLFHLVFTSDYQRPETVPLGTPAEWAWLGPLVFQALKTCPDVMMPQFLVAANALEVRSREQIRYEFHEQLIDSWFGEEKNELFGLIAASAVQLDHLDPNAQAYVRAGQLEAKKRIERR